MNMKDMMAQVQRMQKDITAKQNEINSKEFISKVQGIEIIMNGDRTLKSIKIDKEIIKNPEDIELLEDMIQVAFNDVMKKISDEIEKQLGAYGNGLNGLL